MAVFKSPTVFGEKRPFHGPALHVFGALVPISDLQRMGISWVRLSVEAPPYSDAAIDDFIHHYMGNGISILWLMRVEAIGGVFTVPTAQARQIAERWAYAGYSTPVFELTNEYVSSHHGHFDSEAANIEAYITQVQAFQADMEGYDYLVTLCNDHADYWRKFYDALLVAGRPTLEAVLAENVIQGLHHYAPHPGAPGTIDFCEKMLQIDAVFTEGQYEAVQCSKANCVSWLTGMYQSMGDRPWAAFASHQSGPYNEETQGYAWYDTAIPNENGVPVLSGRTPTLMEYASAIGVILR